MNLLAIRIMLTALNPSGVIAKAILSKFKYLTDKKFILHLKESEFKCRKENLYKILVEILRKIIL